MSDAISSKWCVILKPTFQLMTNLLCSSPANGAKANPTTTTSSIEQNVPNEFAQCVENISVLNLRLKNSEERCQLLKSDLRQAKQVCANMISTFIGRSKKHLHWVKYIFTLI